MQFHKYLPHYRANLKLAIPIIISQAGQMLTGIVDNAMIGHVSTTSLAASAFANNVFNILMVFGMGFCMGLTPLVGQLYGRKEYEQTGVYFRSSLVLNLVLAFLLMGVLFSLEPLLPHFGQEPAVVEEATPYYRIISFSLLPLILMFTGKQYAEGLSSTKPAMIVVLASNVLNVFLNYLLIYGNWGFPEMGLVGAGWATFSARVFAGVAFIFYLFKARYFNPFLKGFFEGSFSWERMKEILTIGLPIGLQFIIEVASFAIGGILIGTVSHTALAAHQIAIGLAALTFMMAGGFASAVTIRASNFYGNRQVHELDRSVKSGYHLTFGFMCFTALIFIFGNGFLAELHTSDPLVITSAKTLLMIAAIFQLFDGGQVVGLSALRGISDVKIPTFLVLIAHWALALPTGAYLIFNTDLDEVGMWIGFCTGLSVVSVLLYLRYRHNLKKWMQASATRPK